MPKLRVGVLYDAWSDGVEDAAEAKAGRRKARRRKADHEEVYEALKKTGHEPFYHVLDGTPATLHALADLKADLYFNLTESYAGDDTKEMNVAAYLDLLGRRYTGAGPQGLYLAQDKALAKKIFAFHGIHTPYFMTGYRGRLEWAHDIHFPVIVKPALEDGSIGIRFSAVVGSLKELMERIDQVHADFDGPVLIEEYIEGREIYVAVLGNQDPEALPIVELDLSQLPEGTPRIAGTEVKWEEGTEVYRTTQPFFPDDLDEATERRLRETACAAYQALKLRDYGRIDIRLDAQGTAHVIEVNPNPWLLSTAEFAKAARKSSRSHCELIAEIVQLAMARYGA
jgi:D-alanine-D-alanine ligase